MHSFTAFLVSLAAQRVHATGWTNAPSFSCPENIDNVCAPEQASGYDWSGLAPGPFTDYGSNSFTGWNCTNSTAELDVLIKRASPAKAITANLDDKPTIQCTGDDKMSIHQVQISSNQNQEIEAHYGMPDGSLCVQTHSCQALGSVIINTQCGGATNVTFQAPEDQNSGCTLAVHSISFHCGRSSSSNQTMTLSDVIPSTKPSSISTTTAIGLAASSKPASLRTMSSVPTWAVPGSSDVVLPLMTRTTGTGSTLATSLNSTLSAPTESTASSIMNTSTTTLSTILNPTSTKPFGVLTSTTFSSPLTSAYITSINNAASNPDTVSGLMTDLQSTGLTSVPNLSAASVLETFTTYSTTEETITSCASSITDCPAGTAIAVSGQASADSAVTSPLVAEAESSPSAPVILPRCLNTWLFETNCKDNTDYTCYCRNSDFVKKVAGCIDAWKDCPSASQTAASYLMGLCAPFVPQNPAIITAWPSSLTTGFTASSDDSASLLTTYATQVSTIASCASSAIDCPASTTTYTIPTTLTLTLSRASVPMTAVTYLSSGVVVPATYTTGESSGYAVPGSSVTTFLSTAVTVPQVLITTEAFTSSWIGLDYGPPSLTVPQAPTWSMTLGSNATASVSSRSVVPVFPSVASTPTTTTLVPHPTSSSHGPSLQAGRAPGSRVSGTASIFCAALGLAVWLAF